MSTQLKGKVALVTGASKGIGAAIARQLAADGAAVAINYAGSRDGAEKTVNTIISEGGKAIAIQGDVSKKADVTRIIATVKETYGRLDILVNNAGVYAFGTLDDFSEEDYHRQFGINVLGPFLLSQAALPLFPETGGSIVNISSVVGERPLAGSSVYSATKGAVDTFTKALAVELGGRNIRVNAVAPGIIATEGYETAGVKDSDLEKDVVSRTPLARVGQPQDIARIVSYLASENAGWLTGEILTAAGGF